MKEDQAEVRREKLKLLLQQRVQPYGSAFPKTEPIQALVERYAERRAVTVERLDYNPDGSLRPVIQTEKGLSAQEP